MAILFDETGYRAYLIAVENESYKLTDYDYKLPRELIAQFPPKERGTSRLLILNRNTGEILDRMFSDLSEFLRCGDVLVLNNTRVFNARLIGTKTTGGKAEIFLLSRRPDNLWEALVSPGRRMGVGVQVSIGGKELVATVVERLTEGRRLVRLECDGDIFDVLERVGKIPLPKYIKREPEQSDSRRYQTVYAMKTGAVAAPTAGLHFTEAMLDKLASAGIEIVFITLHTGWGTFREISVDDIRSHGMHSEFYEIGEEAAGKIRAARSSGGRVIAVGTTTVRALESAAGRSTQITTQGASTELYIYPPYDFRITDAMLTNFHLPRSSLLVMVSAFAGREKILRAYSHAIAERYRFFSYGDAMLII